MEHCTWPVFSEPDELYTFPMLQMLPIQTKIDSSGRFLEWSLRNLKWITLLYQLSVATCQILNSLTLSSYEYNYELFNDLAIPNKTKINFLFLSRSVDPK